MKASAGYLEDLTQVTLWHGEASGASLNHAVRSAGTMKIRPQILVLKE